MSDDILLRFNYQHLPVDVRDVAMPFHVLAHRLAQVLPKNPERAIALRKLCDAKDTAVVSMMLAARFAP
jgi:hypothetical protein